MNSGLEGKVVPAYPTPVRPVYAITRLAVAASGVSLPTSTTNVSETVALRRRGRTRSRCPLATPPSEPCELVGQGDGGLVVAEPALETECPAAQAVGVATVLARTSTERAPWMSRVRR